MSAQAKLKVEIPAKLADVFEPHRYKIIYGGRGSSKCLGIGTRVIMADGTLRPVESVMAGDQVMGPDSQPRNVLSTTRGTGMLYRVKQTSAMDYVVNADHVLSLKKSTSSALDRGKLSKFGNWKRSRGRYPDWPDVTNMPLAEWVEQSNRWREHFRGYRAGLLHFPDRKVTIDPYTLGLWLGDGTAREVVLTTMDAEIEEAWEAYAESVGGRTSVWGAKGRAKYLAVTGIKGARIPFVYYGLMEPKARGGMPINLKHIPQDYLLNSEAVRLSVLAGMIDTDGHYHNGTYQITQSNGRLAADLKRLADGLGFRTSIKLRATTCQIPGYVGKAWSIAVCGDIWRIPCRLPRKSVRQEDMSKNKDFLLSKVSVEPIGEGEYAGFALDGDHLFLLEDGTVTHNSWTVARALVAMGVKQKLRVLCGREFQRSIKDSVHKLLCDQIDLMGLTRFYRTTQTSITGTNGTEFLFEGLRFNASKLKSLEGIDVAWLEQAETVSQSSLDILLPTIRKENSEIWMTINPVLEDDPAYQGYVVNPPEGAWVVEQNWRDNPWFTGVLMDEMERLRARDPDLCAHIYDGQCLHALEGAIYANELRKAVAEDRIGAVPYIPGSPVHTAWDLGHSDNTAIWFFQRIGFEYHLIDFLQNNAQRIDFYLKELQNRGYLYGRHYLPHDAANGFLAGRSIEDQVSDVYGRASVVVVPRTDNVAADIDICRTTFDLCHFDKAKCADGLHSLRHYRYGVDENTGRRSRLPLHDFSSDAADSFRTFCVGFRPEKRRTITPERFVMEIGGGGDQGGGNTGWLGV